MLLKRYFIQSVLFADHLLKTEEVTTSVFITALWSDYRLAWNPEDYNGLNESRIPAHTVWRPDIVLYNNDDGNYDPTVKTNVIIKYTGVCEWMPPAIYKSDCKIHIDLFPFDWQNCTMVSHCSTVIQYDSYSMTNI